MLKIRLAQRGSANRRTYRLVVIEEGKRRNGRELEIVGYYNPLVKPIQIVLKKDRISYWISQGAKLTPSAQNLFL